MFEKIRTLMGYTLEEVREILDQELEPAAYSPVPHGADLTDIKPAWLTETLNRVFGMAGVGWMFQFAPESMYVDADTDKKGRTKYHAVLRHLTFRYRVVINDELVWSEPIPANGGSDNYDEAYATRGALTNALGAAASKIGWQISIYQGKRSHHTVQANVDPADIRLTFGKHNGKTLGDVPEGYLGWLADNANEASLRNAAKRLLGQSKRKKTKPQKPAPKAKSAPKASGNGNGNGADPELTFGKHKGKRLSEVMAMGEDGRSYIQWLADRARNEKIKAVAQAMLTGNGSKAPSDNGNGGGKGKGDNGNGNDQGMPLAHAKAVELPYGTRSHPEYRGKTLGELEQINPPLLDFLVDNGRMPAVMEAAAAIVAARA